MADFAKQGSQEPWIMNGFGKPVLGLFWDSLPQLPDVIGCLGCLALKVYRALLVDASDGTNN